MLGDVVDFGSSDGRTVGRSDGRENITAHRARRARYLWAPPPGEGLSVRSSFQRAILLLRCAAALLVAACGDASGPGTPPTALMLVPVDSGYDFSVYLTAPPADPHRLLVVERGGRIR